MSATGPWLALDTASPRVSVACGRAGAPAAVRELAQESSSRELLAAIEAVLAEAGVARRELAGVVAVAGPGSFTGLRVGLATALGLHQALGLAATTVTTFEALAAASDAPRLLAVVDALRGEWYAQELERREDGTVEALGEPRRLTLEELRGEPGPVVGVGVRALLGDGAQEPGPLAAAVLRLAAAGLEWDAARLSRPLYLRDAQATLPKPRTPIPAA